MMDVLPNTAMKSILEMALKDDADLPMPGYLAKICQAGCMREGDLVFLSAMRSVRRMRPDFDAWGSERWINQISLRAHSTQSWQVEMVREARKFAKCILMKARPLTDLPLQVTISLNEDPTESAEDALEPAGSLFLNVLREPSDDLRRIAKGYTQPVLFLTTDASAQ